MHYNYLYCNYSNKSNTCDWATMFLNENGIKAINLHGDMLYDIRQGRFKKYQDGSVNILVTTDVGSRGLNTIRVNHYLWFSIDYLLYVYYFNHMVFRPSILLTMNSLIILLTIYIDVDVLAV